MPSSKAPPHVAVLLAGFFLLLWPLLYVGYPTIFVDSFYYLKLGVNFPKGDMPFRPPFYGLLLATLGTKVSMSAVAALQAAFFVYWIRLLAESVLGSVSAREYLFLALVAGVFTALPWLCTHLIPDVWTVSAALTPFILFHHPRLGRFHYFALCAALSIILLFHFSFWPLTFTCAILTVVLGKRLAPPATHIRSGVRFLNSIMLAILISMLSVAAYHWQAHRSASFTPLGGVMLLGRLEGHGLVHRYLKTVCPGAEFALCSMAGTRVRDTKGFLWFNGSPFYVFREKVGWKAAASEAERLTRAVLTTYPLQAAGFMLRDTIQQLFLVNTFEVGRPLENVWYTKRFSQFLSPNERITFSQSLQMSRQLPPAAVDFWYRWWIGVSAVLVIIGSLPWLRRVVSEPRRVMAQLAVCILAITVLNAFIAGGLSVVVPRYGARIAWIFPVALALLLITARQKTSNRSRVV